MRSVAPATRARSPALAALFEPESIAVVGASEDATRMGGGLILKFLDLHEYGGAIYPVNPKYETVNGRKCFPSLADIPDPVDLAVLSVPATVVRRTVEALEPGHVKCFLVITSGFGELGEDGRRAEAELMALIRDKGGPRRRTQLRRLDQPVERRRPPRSPSSSTARTWRPATSRWRVRAARSAPPSSPRRSARGSARDTS